MAATNDETLHTLRPLVADTAARSRSPYSSRPEAAALLLSDGIWVPGVRVESASFSLLIPALLNAFTTAVASGRQDVVAVVLDHVAQHAEEAFLAASPLGPFTRIAEDAYVLDAAKPLPPAADRLAPYLDAPAPSNPAAGIALARRVAERAFVPVSHFPVGCVLLLDDGRLLPGVNVEHTDWTRILCAERTVLGTAVTFEHPTMQALYLTCTKDLTCTPCGACRQLLLELAPECMLWMDRGDREPEAAYPSDLLPGAFTGACLSHRSEHGRNALS